MLGWFNLPGIGLCQGAYGLEKRIPSRVGRVPGFGCHTPHAGLLWGRLAHCRGQPYTGYHTAAHGGLHPSSAAVSGGQPASAEPASHAGASAQRYARCGPHAQVGRCATRGRPLQADVGAGWDCGRRRHVGRADRDTPLALSKLSSGGLGKVVASSPLNRR
jgi:hypothetical protein